MQKLDMLKKLFFVMFFKSDQKSLSFQETKNITRSVWKKRSSWCFWIFDYLQFLNHLWKTSQIIYFFCAQNFEYNMDCYIVLTTIWFICSVQHSNIPSKQKKYYQTKLEKRMFCQIWRFQLRNTLKLSHKKKRNFNQSTTLFFKTT